MQNTTLRQRGAGLIEAWRKDIHATLPAATRLLYLAWALYTAYVFVHAGALVHDEAEFLVLAKSVSFLDFVSKAPPALYGSLFWVLLKLAGGALVARIILLAMMLMTPYLLMRAMPDARARLFLFVLWLTFPIAWWSGKLISPEIPTMFLVALALLWYGQGRVMASAFLLGLAAALKISAVPVVLFFAARCVLDTGVRWGVKLRQLGAMAAVFLLALVLGFPSIVVTLQQLAQQQTTISLPLPALLTQVLQGDRWEWDGVFSGGVLAFSMAGIPLALAVLSALAGNWRMVLSALPAVLGFLFLSARSTSYYGWYWMAFFPVLLLTLAQLPTATTPVLRRCSMVCLALAVALNAVLQLPLISDQVNQKAEQIRFVRNHEAIEACVNRAIDQYRPRSIYKLTESALVLHTDVPVTRWPGPEADAAEMTLMSTRMLVNKRFPAPSWSAPPIVASCDTVLVFSKK
jgi:hypothetical protein